MDVVGLVAATGISTAIYRCRATVGLGVMMSMRLGVAMSESGGDLRPAVVAAVVVKDGQVLLVRRRVSEGDLSWQFPGGEVDADESGEQAAVRETQEETGLSVLATGSLGRRIHPGTGRTVVYVACDVMDGTADVGDLDEIAEVAWCGRAGLADYVRFPFHEPVRDYLDANLR